MNESTNNWHQFILTLSNVELSSEDISLIEAKLETYALSLVDMIPGTTVEVQHEISHP